MLGPAPLYRTTFSDRKNLQHLICVLSVQFGEKKQLALFVQHHNS